MDTIHTETFTIRATYTYHDNETRPYEEVTVSALVQDGRSCGAYVLEHTYPTEQVETAVRAFLKNLSERGQEIHPDLS